MAEKRDPLASLIFKINQCIDYQTLYCLEDDFNTVGLTIQTTSKNRIILCKIENGKAVSNKPIDDYIFIKGLDNATEEISPGAAEKIIAFVQNAKGKPGKIKNVPRKWQDGLRMYEQSVAIGAVSENEERGEAITESKEYPIIES
jgi:hypothetical protein